MSTKEVLEGHAGGIECRITDGEEVLSHFKRLFGEYSIRVISELGNIMICSGVFTEAYILPKNLVTTVIKLFTSGYVPYSAGLYVGRLRRLKPRFIPSINALYIIYKNIGLKRALMVSEEGLKPFLYGNDILKMSVIKCFEPIDKDEVVGIVGSDKYVYGIGLSTISSCEEIKKLKDVDVVAYNVFDVGWYLRGGTESREHMIKL